MLQIVIFIFLRLPTDTFLGHLFSGPAVNGGLHHGQPAETDSYPWLHGTALASQGGHFSRN